MEEKIRVEAARLYDLVMREYLERREEPFPAILEREMKGYNEAVAAMIWAAIMEAIRDSFTRDIPAVIATPAKLSKMLHRNARETAAVTLAILRHEKIGAKTFTHIARLLYDGYGWRDREVMEVRKKAPRYLESYLRRHTTQREVMRQIEKLRTKPLRAAYKKIVKLAEKGNRVAVKRAVKVALEEKARYYANRIAQTEQARAKNLARAKEYLDDPDIEMVKYRMSSLHPVTDICDYFAKLDVGYGPGIVPKEKMVALPLHPHCRCRYDPWYLPVKRKKPKDTLEQMSKEEQHKVLGTWENWKEWKEGTPAVLIMKRQYDIVPVTKVL